MPAHVTHVVVTGAGGFVGGYVARWLADRGNAVTALARRQPVAAQRGLVWREADLRAADSLPNRFDVLIHCAAETPARCPDPELLYHANMQVCRSVFGQAVAAGAGTIVFMSSMSMYGRIAVPVVTEETIPVAAKPKETQATSWVRTTGESRSSTPRS